jgi:psp operon transcriptional activator
MKIDFIGESPAFLDLLDHSSKAAKLNKPILIIGERGTGKELIAERIHYLSTVWDGPFIKLNCATLSDELLASELFGHEAGSFTGATRKHVGRFERARGGTIFLDEIANTNLRLQEKILRVIEYGEFERVGGSDTIHSDARIVAATNIDLPSACEQGSFRFDLLDRLAFDVITLPPLRERKEDILLLANHFAFKMTGEMNREYFSGFTADAANSLNEYSWPGNVRELKNVIERAVYKFSGRGPLAEIQFNPFDSPYRQKIAASAEPPKEMAGVMESQTVSSSINFQQRSQVDLKDEVIKFEQEIIKSALLHNRYNKRKTAESLSLTYNQFRGILRKYSIG